MYQHTNIGSKVGGSFFVNPLHFSPVMVTGSDVQISLCYFLHMTFPFSLLAWSLLFYCNPSPHPRFLVTNCFPLNFGKT